MLTIHHQACPGNRALTGRSDVTVKKAGNEINAGDTFMDVCGHGDDRTVAIPLTKEIKRRAIAALCRRVRGRNLSAAAGR